MRGVYPALVCARPAVVSVFDRFISKMQVSFFVDNNFRVCVKVENDTASRKPAGMAGL